MREKRTSLSNRSTVSGSREAKKKYILVFEGEKTEEIYFNAVKEARDAIGINPLIDLVSVKREFSEKGWSNPQKIVDRIIFEICNTHDDMTYGDLPDHFLSYLEDAFPDIKLMKFDIYNDIKSICEHTLHKSLSDPIEDIKTECSLIANTLNSKYPFIIMIDNILEYISSDKIIYQDGFDKICLIVDRDRKSFTDSQYKYVSSVCKTHNFNFHVTNPCFEFWLLMHFPSVTGYDTIKMKKNEKDSSSGKTYAEQCLLIEIPDYQKVSYNATNLVKQIDTAIENEKKFCEDINKLRHSIGSNIGLLITELRE